MAVEYTLVERSNPSNPAAPKKWYAQAVSTGEVTLKSLCKQITQRCTVNSADTLAVLDALTQELVEQLGEGRIVRFGDFGSFQISISGEGADTKEQFHASLIKSEKVVFRPGATLKEMLKTLIFKKK
jgi:predicted histone-like DNA-binding protein